MPRRQREKLEARRRAMELRWVEKTKKRYAKLAPGILADSRSRSRSRGPAKKSRAGRARRDSDASSASGDASDGSTSDSSDSDSDDADATSAPTAAAGVGAAAQSAAATAGASADAPPPPLSPPRGKAATFIGQVLALRRPTPQAASPGGTPKARTPVTSSKPKRLDTSLTKVAFLKWLCSTATRCGGNSPPARAARRIRGRARRRRWP